MASGDRPDTSPDDTGSSAPRSSPPKSDQAKKRKAGSSKKMTQKEQSERFKEMARELGTDETGETFERVIDRLFLRSADSS